MRQNIDKLSPKEVEKQIEYLREFMLESRYETLKSKIDMRTQHMVLCLEDMFHTHNASATIRSAEAFGLQQMEVIENVYSFKPSRDIVRGTDQWIDINSWQNKQELVEYLRSRSYRIVITSPREGSATLESFDVQKSPFAIFMGAEKRGISDYLEQQADESIHIPMVGFAESLNVSVSAAIIAQNLTHRIRQMPVEQWQLPCEDKNSLLLRWMKESIRDVENVLSRMSDYTK